MNFCKIERTTKFEGKLLTNNQESNIKKGLERKESFQFQFELINNQ